MTQTTDRLTEQDLAARLADETAAGPDPGKVRDILAQFLAQPDHWIHPTYQQLREGAYAPYPIYRDELGRCSMLVVVIGPDTCLPVHDHGTWAVVGVYKGRERDTWYRRLHRRGVPGRAQLEVEQVFINETGAVAIVPQGTIHSVEALDGLPAVSLHVYGTDIVTQERSEFDLDTGAERIFRPPFQEVRPL